MADLALTAPPEPRTSRLGEAWHGVPGAVRWPALLLLVLVLALLLAEWNGWRFLRAPIEQRLSQAVGAPVHIDEFAMRLLRPHPFVAASQVQVDSRAGFGVPHVLAASELRIEAGWGDLWRFRGGEALRLRSLAARTLDVNLVRHADGSANWRADRPATPPGAEPPEPIAERFPRVGLVSVPQGRVTVDDRPLNTQLRIDLASSEGGAGVDARAPRGPGGGAFSATVSGRVRNLPLHLQVQFAPVFDGERAQQEPQVVLRLEGEVGRSKLRFDGSVAPLSGARTLLGEVLVEGPSLAAVGQPLGLTLPSTPPFKLVGRLQRDDRVWRLEARSAEIGSSSLAGEFVFDQRPERPKLTGTLRGRRLAFADLGPAIGTDGKPRTDRAGRVLPQRQFEIPRLRAMDADVAVDVAQLDFGTAALAPFDGVKARVRLADGVLSIDDLRGHVGKGRVAGRTRLDGRGDTAAWSADLELRGVEIEDWIQGVKKEPKDARDPKGAKAPANPKEAAPGKAVAYVTGEMVAVVNVTGRGKSTAEILASMDGKARAMLQNGTLSHLATELAGIDVAQALGIAISGDKPLPLRCARIDLLIDDGVATPTLAVLDNRDSTVRIEGKIDLRDESLALRATVKPKDVSFVSLRAPLQVTGHLSDPKIGVEGSKLAPRLLAALALGLVAPAAAVIPLVDAGSAPAASPCSEAATARP